MMLKRKVKQKKQVPCTVEYVPGDTGTTDLKYEMGPLRSTAERKEKIYTCSANIFTASPTVNVSDIPGVGGRGV